MSRQHENLKCYTGIADSAGLESFILWSDVTDHTLNFMRMRRLYGSERSAIIYRCFLNQADVDIVEQFLQERKFKHALYYMKLHAVETQVESGATQAQWDNIPQLTMAEAQELENMQPKVKAQGLPTNQLDLL
jgi:hypothetical protein